MKRIFDFLVALVLLVLLSPVMLAVAIGVFLDVGSPILFRQLRPGLHGRSFTIYKFRTMRAAGPAQARADTDHQRLTRFGRWLRAMSLDELPELWNVLRGDMSLVGPRPLLMQYLPLYSPEQMRRHEVRPGLTGWAQVNGRNALSWEEKFKFDVWYVDNRSMALDIRILFLSLKAVTDSHGISHNDSATMPEFTGSLSKGERSDER
jgi:lipopolysaccharide/colanic/teichoic acid biosynthesis glycosyltransferase